MLLKINAKPFQIKTRNLLPIEQLYKKCYSLLEEVILVSAKS